MLYSRQINKTEMKETVNLEHHCSFFIHIYLNLMHLNTNQNIVWKQTLIILTDKRMAGW